MTEKERVLDYMEKTFVGAKMANDIEMMCRLSRAVIAFSYDDLENIPSWEKMLESYMMKDLQV